jgi:hypothetical protein
MKIPGIRLFVLCALIVALPKLVSAAQGARLSAQVAVERQEVFVGEAFTFQIQISGSQQPDRPQLPPFPGFRIQELGGQQNSSSSITIINGKMTKVVREGYIFNYQLTPLKAGRLIIPAITVKAKGQTARTQAIPIQAKKPIETDEFKLRLALSKTQCYVGEPITLSLTWYFNQNVRAPSFNMPILEDQSIILADPPIDTNSGNEYLQIPFGNGQAYGLRGAGVLDGERYATLTIKKVLIPQQAQSLQIAPATLAFEVLVGRRQTRSRSFFDSAFDDFFGASRDVYRKAVVASNNLSLDILELPTEGQPANFAGHVGEYKLSAEANPTAVNVGDPITLTVFVSGPEYLEHIDLPNLRRQSSLNSDFKIPAEIAPGVINGGGKVFTQTIRALHPDITQIPPIELPYFDTKARKYRLAKSKPIPLKVNAVKVVTASDAEGPSATAAAARKLESWTRGIAHNYTGKSVLIDQRQGPKMWVQSPLWMGMIGSPPIMYFLLYAGVFALRRRNANSALIQARRAYGKLTKKLNSLTPNATDQEKCEEILEALRSYLGDKLGLPAGALTYKDVLTPLRSHGVAEESLEVLKGIFTQCEAGRYAGSADAIDLTLMTNQITSLAKNLERLLK